MFAVLNGASSASAAGRTAFPMLLIQTEPRGLALGGAPITELGWTDGTLLNPASAAGGDRMVSASFARHMLDLWSGRVAASFPVKGGFTVGGYISTLNYGEFDVSVRGTGATGEQFRAAENVLAGYVAGQWGASLGLGMAAKLVWGAIDDDRASGAAIDLGITFDPHWEQFRFGMAVRNIGVQFSSYGSETYPLPTLFTVGGSKPLLHLPLTVSVVGVFSRKGEGEWEADFLPGEPGVSFGVGGEFDIPAGWSGEPMHLRIGYRSQGESLRVGHRLDILAGFSFGVGIPYRSWEFDYTYAPMGALGDLHRFGVAGIL